VDIITNGDGRTSPKHFDPLVLAAFEANQQAFDDVFESLAA